MAVCVDGFEGNFFELVHGAQANIAGHAIGKAVGAQSQQILGKRAHGHGGEKLKKNGHDAGKSTRPGPRIKSMASPVRMGTYSVAATENREKTTTRINAAR